MDEALSFNNSFDRFLQKAREDAQNKSERNTLSRQYQQSAFNFQSVKETSEEANGTLKLAEEAGVPPERAKILRDDTKLDVMTRRLAESPPNVQEFLADENNSAMYRDNIQELNAFDEAIKALPAGSHPFIQRGIENEENRINDDSGGLSQIPSKILQSFQITDAELDLLLLEQKKSDAKHLSGEETTEYDADIDAKKQRIESLGTNDNFVTKAIGSAIGSLDNIFIETALEGKPIVGALPRMFQLNYAENYQTIKDVDIDEGTKRQLSFASALLSTSLDVVGFGVVARGFKKTIMAKTNKILVDNFVKRGLQASLAEGTTEGLQSAVTNFTNIIAKGISDTESPTEEDWDRIIPQAIEGFGMGLVGGATFAVGGQTISSTISIAKRNQDALLDLVKKRDNLKVQDDTKQFAKLAKDLGTDINISEQALYDTLYQSAVNTKSPEKASVFVNNQIEKLTKNKIADTVQLDVAGFLTLDTAVITNLSEHIALNNDFSVADAHELLKNARDNLVDNSKKVSENQANQDTATVSQSVKNKEFGKRINKQVSDIGFQGDNAKHLGTLFSEFSSVLFDRHGQDITDVDLSFKKHKPVNLSVRDAKKIDGFIKKPSNARGKFSNIDLTRTREEIEQQYADIKANKKSFFKAKRGSYTTDNKINGEKVITVFGEGNDFTTILHETGHFMLDVYQSLAESKKAPASLKEEWQNIKDWLGVDGKLTVAQHEKFAESFETYLFQGKAPSKKLTRAFDLFSEWFMKIYKVARETVKIDAEAKNIFDTMLSVEVMVEDTYRTISGEPSGNIRVREAFREALRDAMSRLMGHEQFLRTEKGIKAVKEANGKAKKQVENMPEYFAVNFLKDGGYKIDDKRFSKARLYAKKGDTKTPKEEAFGLVNEALEAKDLPLFKDSVDMADSIASMLPKNVMIETVAREIVSDSKNEYKSPKKVNELLVDSVINGKFMKDTLTKLNLLEEKSQAKLTTEDRMIEIETQERQKVKNTVSVKTLDDNAKIALDNIVFLTRRIAVAKANKNDALAISHTKDLIRAYHTYIENRVAIHELGVIKKTMTRYSKQLEDGKSKLLTINKIDANLGTKFGSIFDYILVHNGFKNGDSIIKNQDAFIDALDASNVGYYADSVVGANYRNFDNMSVQDAYDLFDTIKSVETATKNANSLYVNGKEIDLTAIAGTFAYKVGQMQNKNLLSWIPFFDGFTENANRHNPAKPAGGATYAINSAQYMLKKATFFFKEVDAGEHGSVWDVTRGMLNESNQKFIKMSMRNVASFQEIMSHRIKNKSDSYKFQRSEFKVKAFDGTNYENTTMAELYVMALNIGRAENRKLLENNGLTVDMVASAMQEVFTAKDVKSINDLHKILGRDWKDSRKQEKRITGRDVEPSEAIPLELTISGKKMELTGGYFPVKYEAETGGGGIPKGVDKSYMKPITGNSETPLRLDMSVMFQHQKDVANTLAFEDTIIDMNKLLGHKAVKDALLDKIGYSGVEMLDSWVSELGYGSKVKPQSKLEGRLTSGLYALANHSTVHFLAYSVPTTIGQWAGLIPAIHENPKYMVRAMVESLLEPSMVKDFIGKDGMETLDYRFSTGGSQDISKTLRMGKIPEGKIEKALEKFKNFHNTGMTGMSFVDNRVARTVLYASYSRALDGNVKGVTREGKTDAEFKAKALLWAIQEVYDTQGTNLQTDKAYLQGNTGIRKAIYQFQTYLNTMYNQFTAIDKRTYGGKAEFVGKMVFYAILTEAVFQIAKNGWHNVFADDEDDRGLFDGVLISQILSVFAGIPFAFSVQRSARYGGSISLPVLGLIDTQIEAFQNIGEQIPLIPHNLNQIYKKTIGNEVKESRKK